MTVLTKQIKRLVRCRDREVVVTIDGETQRVGFREKGSHKTFWIPVMTAYALAVRITDNETKSGRNTK